MTLSLDDVRSKRFRMARKSGYEVLEVDEFVDEVEEAFAQLIEENQNLKKQVDSLKSTGGPTTISAPVTTPRPGTAAGPGPNAVKTAPLAPEPARIVVTTAKEASTAVVRLVEMTTEQAERLVQEATAEANGIREEADRSAQSLTADARSQAEKVQTEARTNAEQLQSGAETRAQKLDREIESRRADTFAELEKQRDQLNSAVSDLRQFEATYRSTMTEHLRRQMEAVATAKAEPVEVPPIIANLPSAPAASGNEKPAPAAAGDGPGGPAATGQQPPATDNQKPTSETPRLDALLGDQH